MAQLVDPKSVVLTIKAAASVLGVSEQTLRRWDKSGKLSPHRNPMNGYRLYARQAVLELKNKIYGVSRTAV